MDPKIAKKTQDSLGKVIKKPPLTEKLLSKPPFRFLHDVMTSVIKTTGVMKGLFSDSELNSENVKDKDSKIAFLQKAIDFVSHASGKSLPVKPAKVVAGHEPERTNEFLQALAAAISNKVDNDSIVDAVKKGGKPSSKKEEKEEKPQREKSSDRRRRDEDKKSRDREEKSRDREKEDRHKEKEDKHHKEKEERPHKDREDKHKDRDEKPRERDRERESRHKSGRGSRKREEEGKENDAPKETMVNGDHKQSDAPTKMQRPTSAKGSRRRMEDGGLSSDEDVPAQKQDAGFGGEDDTVPSQPVGRLARPSSARPAPPKRKDDIVQQEPAMRLGSGKPQNLILDDGKDSDEDETFVVEEAAPPPMEPEQPPPMAGDEDDDEDHGGLVKKIMETKKEYEQPRENKIERPTISDAQRRKQREAVQKEVDKLRGSIQTLTRSANPLGKIMDYVQEDLDSMQKELEKWKQENKEHGLALKREKAITERAVEPLKVQLGEVDQAIKDQLDLIGAVKSNIIRNDQKTEKMLRTIAKS
ncbi:TRAF3-interacting protein 1-like isoform X3 [Mya arenaria]|uniref:TRAF3-interacting protein 1-like isoform X3 n=1 Tax=Mya arenaria TaxID=6604 RepID=UPI0022E46D12|nr:TRAF3-interacting protein 1-like isoform X3 [Mya arenaria]